MNHHIQDNLLKKMNKGENMKKELESLLITAGMTERELLENMYDFLDIWASIGRPEKYTGPDTIYLFKNRSETKYYFIMLNSNKIDNYVLDYEDNWIESETYPKITPYICKRSLKALREKLPEFIERVTQNIEQNKETIDEIKKVKEAFNQ